MFALQLCLCSLTVTGCTFLTRLIQVRWLHFLSYSCQTGMNLFALLARFSYVKFCVNGHDCFALFFFPAWYFSHYSLSYCSFKLKTSG